MQEDPYVVFHKACIDLRDEIFKAFYIKEMVEWFVKMLR